MPIAHIIHEHDVACSSHKGMDAVLPSAQKSPKKVTDDVQFWQKYLLAVFDHERQGK